MTLQGQWTVLYDAARDGCPAFIFPVVGLLFVAVGVVLARSTTVVHTPGGGTALRRGPPGARAFLTFAVGWTLLTGAWALGSHLALVRALRRGEYDVVQGVVEDYTAADLLRERPETWSVAGRTYAFHDAVFAPGFDSPGVVRPGMRVRLADVGGAIARLEAARW